MYEQIHQLNLLLANSVENILQELNIKYRNFGSYISLSCPIHFSGSSRSLSIVIDEQSPYFGYYKCWSHSCEEQYGKSILGFLYGYFKTNIKEQTTKQDIIKWSLDFLQLKSLDDIKIDPQTIKKKHYIKRSNILITTK